MVSSTPFFKLNGLGNDFVLIDHRRKALGPALTKSRIRHLGDRKRGVGFDQLLVLEKSPRAQARLHIYNTDGTRAEMCGNGLRAAALHLWTEGGVDPRRELLIHTDAGLLRCRPRGPLSKGMIETEMGIPHFPSAPRTPWVPTVLGARPVLVNVGNPHAVYWLTPPQVGVHGGGLAALTAATRAWLTRHGSAVENHRAFPRRTNVEFARVRSPNRIDAYVWERGVGLTEACGTGAVAVACAALREGLCSGTVSVGFPGGTVSVRWQPGESAFLTGKVEFSFSGRFY